MKTRTPKRDPLTTHDCREITRWLVAARRGITKPFSQQRIAINQLIARFQEHSYIHRVTLEQAALIAKNSDL